jgi:membrane-bound ClpP family serine protease
VLGYFGTSAGNFVLSHGTIPLLSTFFFLWFLGVLYGVLRRAEGVDGVLSTVVLAGGIVFITLSCAGYAVEIMHPAAAQRFINFVPDPQLAFASLAVSAWLYHFCQVGDAVMISAASLAVLGSGVLPRWLALVGLLAAILTLLHFLLPLVGAVSGLVWVALVSALMLGGLSQGSQALRRRARRQ